MRVHRMKAILVGRSLRTSLEFLAIAAGLFILGLVVALLQFGSRAPLFESQQVLGAVGAAVVVGSAATSAYRNEGLVVSLIVATAPVLAVWLFIAYRAGLVTRQGLLWAAAFALVYGVPLGALGFAVGTEAARWRPSGDDDPDIVDRRFVLLFTAVALLAGGAIVGYCSLEAVSCTLPSVA